MQPLRCNRYGCVGGIHRKGTQVTDVREEVSTLDIDIGVATACTLEGDTFSRLYPLGRGKNRTLSTMNSRIEVNGRGESEVLCQLRTEGNHAESRVVVLCKRAITEL